MLRQFAVVPVLWMSGKVDLTQPQNLFILQCVFAAVIGFGYFGIQV